MTNESNAPAQTEETPVPTSHVGPSTRGGQAKSPLGPEPVTIVRCRTLIGWMSEQEAVTALLGRSPGPGDDVAEPHKVARAHRDAVGRRPPFIVRQSVVDRNEPVLAEIGARPELMAELGATAWRPALVDLRNVIAFQKAINLEGQAERVGTVAADDMRALADVCVPPTQGSPPAGAITDGDGKGFTVSSVNPNLRIVGAHVADASLARGGTLPPVRVQALTLFASMTGSNLTAVSYKGRTFLRDGYHRATGLLRRGIFIVPCVHVEARSFEEVVPPGGSFLGYEMLFGDRPPVIADFWDDSVAAEVEQIQLRKVIRIRGDEFMVQR